MSFLGFISKRENELQARLAQGVGKCHDCDKLAAGFCITCNVLLCTEHDMTHLMQDAGTCKEVRP